MRLRSALNGFFLFGNVVLFGLLTAAFLNHRDDVFRTAFWNKVDGDAAKMDMNVSFAKFPFAFFTTKGQRRAHRFTLAQYDPLLLISADAPAVISAEDNGRDSDETHTTLMLHLGQEFSTIIDYSYSLAAGYRVHEIWIVRDRPDQCNAFLDTNADGSYDFRILRDKTRGMTKDEVWFEGNWREVGDTIDTDHKILIGGQEVRFNRRAGKWQSKSEDLEKK